MTDMDDPLKLDLCDMMQPVGVKVVKTIQPQPGMTEGAAVTSQPVLSATSVDHYHTDMLWFPPSFAQTAAFHHWRDIGVLHQLQSDQEIACFLMKCYDEGMSSVHTSNRGSCENCGSPLVTSCPQCSHSNTTTGVSSAPCLSVDPDDNTADRNQRTRQAKARRRKGQPEQNWSQKMVDKLHEAPKDHKDHTLLHQHPHHHQGQQQQPPPQQSWGGPKQYQQVQEHKYSAQQHQYSERTDGDQWSAGEQSPALSDCEDDRDFKDSDGDEQSEDDQHPEQSLFPQEHQPEQEPSISNSSKTDPNHSEKESSAESCEDSPADSPGKDKRKKGRKSKLRKEFYCRVCNKQLSSRQAYDRHITSKLHAISLLPPELQAKRRRRQKATNPQQANQDKSVYFVVTRDGKEEYLCKICSQSFDKVQDVKQHRKQHKEREMCHLCGKTVNVRGFRDHMLRHRGERQFSCSLCPKTFINAALLKDHAIVHTNEKPYCCEVCGACFRHKHTLKFHLRTHSGIKAYRCSQCGAAFTRPRGLSDHMRVHTGEKPYGCHVCGRYFSSSGNLAAHRRKVHKMAPLRPNVPCRLLIT